MMKFVTPSAVCGAAIIAIGLALATAGSLAAGQPPSADGVVLKSLSVTLPESDRLFPDGPGAETITGNCLACHSAGMVLNQPRLDKATWAAEVHKMINTYKAPVSDQDAAAIIDYLAQLKRPD